MSFPSLLSQIDLMCLKIFVPHMSESAMYNLNVTVGTGEGLAPRVVCTWRSPRQDLEVDSVDQTPNFRLHLVSLSDEQKI